ncbi:MAG: TIGR03617 family F420-dependent LLM class oxidoreductase [Candidatus Binatia bacterium]
MRVEVGLMSHPFHENPVMPGCEGMAMAARRIEAQGFDGVLLPEAGGHDPFLPLAIVAEHTKRITLRTGVAVAFPRSPMVTAQIAWDLQRLSGGRFELGLGTQVKGQNERRYAAPWTAAPGPRLREYLSCLQAMFATFQHGDQPAYFTGKHYQFTMMPEFFNPGPIEHPHVPIWIAAVNPYMGRLAGELCDGIFPHPICTAEYLRRVLTPAVAEGAHRAGRPASAVQVLVSPIIATGRDRAEVERKKVFVKQRLGFYASTRSYHAPVELHGFLDVGQQLFRLSMEGKWREMIDLVSDEMLDTFGTVGTWDELGPKLRERWGDVADVVHLDLPDELRGDDRAVRAMIEALH